MEKAVLIAEKPSLMRKLQNVYNKHKNEFNVEIDFLSQAGHVVGLKQPKEIDAEKYGKWKLSNFPEQYPFEYKVSPGKYDLVQNIKNAVKKGNYDYVIHAGDPDGEGELLVRLALEFVGNKLPVKRFWINAETEGEILGALKNLQDDANYDHIYEAALVRQHADYQFGMNCTGVITCKNGDLCKIGRVKAPIISIIAKRELEIRDYVETITYKPAFRYQNCEFVRNEVFNTSEEALKGVPKTEYATISEYKAEKKAQKAPKLFKLSTLQTEAHKQLGFSAAKTLSVLQSLYETGSVSYPRTACEYISSAVDIGYIAKRILKEIEVDTKLLVREPSDVTKDKLYCNNAAIASEGHTAIVPTGKGLSNGASKDEIALYEVICKRFLAMFGPAKETMHIKAVGIPSGSEDEYIYSESYDINPGYELILNEKYKMKKGSGVEFKKGETLHPIEFFAKECVSQKPSRYNDGSIITALEKPEKYEGDEGKVSYNIGTPATRATIIEECVKNGYFTKQKGVFYATDKAIALYEAYKDVPLFMPIESGKWEEMFENIRTGKVDYKEVENTLLKKMEESVDILKKIDVNAFEKEGKSSKSIGSCPNCSTPVTKGPYGLYCPGKCGMSFGKVFGKTMTDSQWSKVLKGERVLLKDLKSQSGKTYNAYVKPIGCGSYSYKKQDGTEVTGLQMKFELDGFEK